MERFKVEDEVLLIPVTKLHDVDEINLAISEGITDIAENKVQEILSKYERVNPVNWHFIGHLQTNKVKLIIDKVKMIHSVDSLRLAKEIDRCAKLRNITMDILIQVNVAGEESKFGISPVELGPLLKEIRENFDNIRIRGLMMIAPYSLDSEEVRKYFREMRKLYDEYKEEYGMDCLSMGMSNDFRVALSEGSNIVRIGTAIFGQRDYSKKQGN
ncbi:MAG: YggS family pyridoxal phosphate-dependent enzyme [Clostridia bacterium]|nr:YggS family pyridoxal phosphate-dependent enzyme [Clostridia bacterium]